MKNWRKVVQISNLIFFFFQFNIYTSIGQISMQNSKDSLVELEKYNYKIDLGQSLDYLLATGLNYKYHKQIFVGFSMYKLKWTFQPEITYFHSEFNYFKDSVYYGRKVKDYDNFFSIKIIQEKKIRKPKFFFLYGIGAGFYKSYSLSPRIPVFAESKTTALTIYPTIEARVYPIKNFSIFINFQIGIWYNSNELNSIFNGQIIASETSKGFYFSSPNPINFGLSLKFN